MDRNRDSLAPRNLPWLLALAGALIALGGHLELIRRFGTALPFRDQWKCTGQDLLGRWVDGQLTWRHFFEPLNDHWPVLTRALSFALARINGQWNNLVEITANALVHAIAVLVFLRMILPALPRSLGGLFAIGAGVVLALPITWENTLWGIQSLVYLQILLSLVYLAAVVKCDRFNGGWFLGQTAGLLVLLTQHSGILAAAAAVPLLLWRLWRREGRRDVTLVNLTIAVVLVVGFFALMPPLTVTAELRADSWRIALDVTLRQLAWPITHPAGAWLIYLPWLVFALDRVARRSLSPTDAFILTAGFWVGAQAAAIGYGRGAEAAGFVSRYCDFLALGLLLNAACLLRFWPSLKPFSVRLLFFIGAIVWVGVASRGLWMESRYGHAGYNLDRRPAVNAENQQAVRDYLTTKDARILSRGSVADTLYTYPPAVAELLEKARFRALLPPETGAVEARRDAGRIGAWILWLPKVAWWIGGLGVLLAVGATLRSRKTTLPASAPLQLSAWTLKGAWFAVGGAGLASVTILALWPGSLDFDRAGRWSDAFAPPSTRVEYLDLHLRSADPNRELSPAAPQQAVATIPAEMRLYWQGTLLDGRFDFQGTLRGEDFEMHRHYLFLPVTGWPSWNGNGLRWRFQNPATKAEKWESFSAHNPVDGVAVWKVDTTPYENWNAALFLFDGGASPQNWVGVARPAVTDNPDFGDAWLALIHAERAEASHRVVAAFAGFCVFLWLSLGAWLTQDRWVSHWRRDDDPST